MHPRIRSRTAASIVPALAGVLAPKCPMCVAAYLSAAGFGATAAAGLAAAIVHTSRALFVAAVLVVAVALVRRARRWATCTSRGRDTADRTSP